MLEHQLSELVEAIEANCGYIMCVAPNAESAHDIIDGIVELAGKDDVVTIWEESGDGLAKAIDEIHFTGLSGDGAFRVFCGDPIAMAGELRRAGFLV